MPRDNETGLLEVAFALAYLEAALCVSLLRCKPQAIILVGLTIAECWEDGVLCGDLQNPR